MARSPHRQRRGRECRASRPVWRRALIRRPAARFAASDAASRSADNANAPSGASLWLRWLAEGGLDGGFEIDDGPRPVETQRISRGGREIDERDDGPVRALEAAAAIDQ